MRRITLCTMVILVGCAHQKPTIVPEPARPRAAKSRSLPVQPRDMVDEPVALARSMSEVATIENFNRLINISGEYLSARECFDSQIGLCADFWRYVQGMYESFSACMDLCPAPCRCVQLFDTDGDHVVTLADFALFQDRFRWNRIQGGRTR